MSIKLKIDADLFYQDLQNICENSTNISPFKFYATLRRLFFLALDDCTKEVGIAFAGPFAKMDFLCKQCCVPRRNYRALKHFRAKIRSINEIDKQELERTQLLDARLLAEFFSNLYHKGIPHKLAQLLPDDFEEVPALSGQILTHYIRVIVNRWDDRFIYANRVDEEESEIQICYAFTPEEATEFLLAGDLSYIRDLLSTGCHLNIIHPKIKAEIYYPELIIYDPDFLVDISTIAETFEEYGLTPLTYLIKRLKPKQNTQPILIGSLAGQFLDEAVYNETPSSYQESATRFFKENALNIISCPKFQSKEFHTEALRQQKNMSAYKTYKLNGEPIFNPEKTLLEPSFFCEMLGIQGRMDLLHDDKQLLIEQKSGKWGFPNGGHQEKHYVQMLFYLAWIKYNQRISTDSVNAMLLYSKYPTEGKTLQQENGLIKESPAPKLLFNAFTMRNLIAHIEHRLYKGEIRKIERLSADDLNVNQCTGPLWTRYQRPEIDKILQSIKQAEPTAKEYFYRFFDFTEHEYHLAKKGFAYAWNTSEEEKITDGAAFFNLHIAEAIEENDSIDSVRFVISEVNQTNLPNFRKGDIIVCYPYHEGQKADIRLDIVFRATITELSKEHLTIKLRSPQRNKNVFCPKKGFAWAVEHDFLDSLFVCAFKDLFSFLAMDNERRKALILNQRKPSLNKEIKLTGDYGEFNELVLKAKQAEDYFLVIGPPGTGKTSFALVNILKETLTDPNASLLLASFTNRAVEEICSKLIKEKIDFIRIGHEHSCSEFFDKSYLLQNKIATLSNANEIKEKLSQTRIFVGTTAAISSSSNLFGIKKFDLAIVDEASQILEPQLIGLLSAENGSAIQKFILIGDHKQLPAIVQQPENESAVSSKELHTIGLHNCRYSLFERLLKLQNGNDEFVYSLHRQGRMHPVISDYINRTYYANKLTPIPLPHQADQPFFDNVCAQESDDAITKLLLSHRLLFLDVPTTDFNSTDNVNKAEAALIIKLVHHIWHLYQEAGRAFETDKSIGIIVPYRAQIVVIKQLLEELNIEELKEITVDTVERYQGSEREVIIYGTTIHNHTQLDFLAGNILEENGIQIDRKLNVAITRAKGMMIMVGNAKLLNGTPSYQHFLQYLRQQGWLFELPNE